MSRSELNEAMTRLAANPQLRDDYKRDGRQVARQLSVPSEVLQEFLELDPVELDRQAEILINRRFQEVSRLIPQTIYDLTQPEKQLFRDYATQFCPTGRQRQIIDTLEFCRYLKECTDESVCHSEVNWVRFLLSRMPFAVRFVTDLVSHGKPCRAIQFFYRKRGEAHGFAWPLPF